MSWRFSLEQNNFIFKITRYVQYFAHAVCFKSKRITGQTNIYATHFISYEYLSENFERFVLKMYGNFL